MRRLALASLFGLGACGSPAAPVDLQRSPGDLAALSDGAAPAFDLAAAVLDLAVASDLAQPPDLRTVPDLAGYPPAPYGNKVGDVIAPLVWEGFINPGANGLANGAPYGALAMNDLHHSGNKYALLYTADDF